MTSPSHAAPLRIQRSRAKGWRMPPNTIYVGRPTIWGNPWAVGLARCGCRAVGECSHNLFCVDTANEAVARYREWLLGTDAANLTASRPMGMRRKRIPELRDRNLACWCPLGQPCHADVLLEVANR